MLNTATFETSFGSIISAKIDVESVHSRQEAWDHYFNLMIETPILLKSMPESETVVLTMQSVFHNVDWVN